MIRHGYVPIKVNKANIMFYTAKIYFSIM